MDLVTQSGRPVALGVGRVEISVVTIPDDGIAEQRLGLGFLRMLVQATPHAGRVDLSCTGTECPDPAIYQMRNIAPTPTIDDIAATAPLSELRAGVGCLGGT